jgi:hypothetical protein
MLPPWRRNLFDSQLMRCALAPLSPSRVTGVTINRLPVDTLRLAVSQDVASAPSPPPSLSLAQIAAVWNVSRAYVSKCKNRGCPTHSIEAANEWRLQNAQRGTGNRSRSTQADGQGEAVESAVPASRKKLSKLTTMDDSLRGSIEIEQHAHRMVSEVTEERDRIKEQLAQLGEGAGRGTLNDRLSSCEARLPNLIQTYNRAKQGRLESEKLVLELKEKMKVLVPMSEAIKVINTILPPHISRLRNLAAAISPRANPHDPFLAEKVIREEIEEAIGEAQQSLAQCTKN